MYLKKGANILLAEDEAPLRQVMAAELRDAGYHVAEAESGVTAVVALGEDFDLLLTDIRMAGGVSGWDLAEAARRIQPDIDVIYMTGYSAEAPKLVERSIFLNKPCTVAEILALTACCSDKAPAQKVILVVDDSATNLELAAIVLEEAGFNVLKAVNGREGIDLARSARPDLVLCDIYMPIADGLEVARTFAADPALCRIPLIALTAESNPAEIPAILAHGFAGYLEKPIVLSKFIKTVRGYFGEAA